MLTLKYVKKASGLMHSYGIARPGELDHEASAFEGPTRRPTQVYVPEFGKVESPEGATVEVTVEISRDEVSGARKFIIS